MLSISSLIDFLLNLLRDDAAQAEFARDPQGMLARHGLEGVTAQDVCDAQPMLADIKGVSPRHHDNDGGRHDGGGHHHHHHHHHRPDSDDPVREIHHVTNNHKVDHDVVHKHHHTNNTYNEYNQYNDHSVTAEEGATVIQDSFNEDNDGVDNKGGIINDSNVAGDDQTDVGNTDVEVEVDDSFNEDNSETTEVTDSFNDESETTTTVDESFNEVSTEIEADINDSYNTDASTSIVAELDAEPAEATV